MPLPELIGIRLKPDLRNIGSRVSARYAEPTNAPVEFLAEFRRGRFVKTEGGKLTADRGWPLLCFRATELEPKAPSEQPAPASAYANAAAPN